MSGAADERMDTLRGIADRVLDTVAERAEAQVTVTATDLGLTRFANSRIHQHVGEDTVAVRLRVADRGRVASLESTRTDDDGLTELVDKALDIAAIRPEDPHWPGVAPPAEIPDVEHDDPYTHRADPADRTADVKAFVDAGEGLEAAGFCDSEGLLVVLANSKGHRAEGRSSRATIDGIHQTRTSAGKAHQTALRLADLDGRAAGETAARLARESGAATDLEPGHYEVVLSPECVATILTFLAFYGFNAKQHLEGQSFAQVGQQQFDRAIDVWDDATAPEALGLPFDAEGTPKRRVDLIDGGVTVSLTHDRRTAKRADSESTGHGIAGGEMWGALAENLFMAPGDARFDDLVSGMERGLVVTEFNYCRILDPKTQVVTGLTRNGTFLVESGEAVRPVTNLRFTQSFVDGLAEGAVRGIGESARFADSEFGPGLVHAPPVHLAAWNFTGGAKG